MAVVCIAEPGVRGPPACGHTGGTAVPSTRPPSAVGVPGGVWFAALLRERRLGAACFMPIPVPFLEFLNPN